VHSYLAHRAVTSFEHAQDCNRWQVRTYLFLAANRPRQCV